MGADQSGLNVRGGLDGGWLALDELHLAGCKFDRTANGASLGNTRIEREETLNVRATRCMVYLYKDITWWWSSTERRRNKGNLHDGVVFMITSITGVYRDIKPTSRPQTSVYE